MSSSAPPGVTPAATPHATHRCHMNQDAQSDHQRTLSNVLVAASLRADQWRHLNASARAWADSKGDAQSQHRARCQELLDTILRIEHCWAYPGERLLGALRD